MSKRTVSLYRIFRYILTGSFYAGQPIGDYRDAHGHYIRSHAPMSVR